MSLGEQAFQYLNMNNAEWTEVGAGIVYVDDPWDLAVALQGQASGIRLQQAPMITSTDGSDQTITGQYAGTVGYTSEVLYGQGRLGVEEERVLIYVSSDGSVTAIFESGVGPTNRLRSATVAGVITFDGSTHHIGVTCNGAGDRLDIFIKGVQPSYAFHNNKAGTGWSGASVSIGDTCIGSDIVNASDTRLQLTSHFSRFKLWHEATDDAGMLEEFNYETLLQGDLFTPTEISTIAWHDASDESTITDSGGDVSQVDDIGTNADLHLVQPTGINQMSTGLQTINGLNVLSSTTDDRYMTGGTFTMPSSGNAIVTILCQVDATQGNNNDSIMSWQTSGGSGSYQFEADSTTEFSGKLRYNDLPTGDFAISGGPYMGIVVWSIVMDFDNSLLKIYANGTLVGSGTYTTKMTGGHLLKLFTNRSNQRAVTGKFGEMFAHEDVSDSQRQINEGYLAWKWGTQASLPSGHPYEFGPPLIDVPVVIGGAFPPAFPSAYIARAIPLAY